VAEREASGDFDYLFEDTADDAGLTGDESQPEDLGAQFGGPDDDLWDDPDDDFWDRDPESADDDFDPFDANTWHFKPAPTPWYRTRQAMTALIAAAAAMAAIVVAGVLLVFRTPATPAPTDDHKATMTPMTPTAPTAPTSAAPATVASSAELPPPPPPPLETSAPSVNTAPDVNYPRVQPRQTKEPEIGVTRTPATRSPISVAPQPRSPRN
jgi:hypothetical protein